MCMVVYAHKYGSPQRSEEGVRAPGAGLPRVCELPGVVTGSEPWSSAKQ